MAGAEFVSPMGQVTVDVGLTTERAVSVEEGHKREVVSWDVEKKWMPYYHQIEYSAQI